MVTVWDTVKLRTICFLDGLEDAETGRLMGSFAQDMANTKGFTREQMDNFAISSLKKAQTAITQGYFKEEIVPIEVKTRKGVDVIDQDEQPLKANLERFQLYALLLARTVQLQLQTQAQFLMVLLR